METITSQLHRILGVNLDDYAIHNIDLYEAASKHETKFTPYTKEVKERVLSKHGLKENSGIDIVDQLYTIINLARTRSFSYINWSKGKKHLQDPVNEHFFHNITRENDFHPIDEAFGIIRNAVTAYQKDGERLRKIYGRDSINSKLSSGGKYISDSKHSIEEVYSLIESIYQNDLASSVPEQGKDPADEMAGNMNRQKFFEDPSTTRIDFMYFTELVIGKRDRYIIMGIPDKVDDITAHILGKKLPSEMVESRLMNKFYLFKSKLENLSDSNSGSLVSMKEEVLSDMNFIENLRKDLSERIREIKNDYSLKEMVK